MEDAECSIASHRPGNRIAELQWWNSSVIMAALGRPALSSANLDAIPVEDASKVWPEKKGPYRGIPRTP
jgi:hypothetical protein